MTDTHPDHALPVPTRQDGAPRHLGIELEFAGVTEDAAAHLVAATSNGTASAASSGVWTIDTPDFGCCEAYLDTRFRKDVENFAGEGGLDMARVVVPVELVTAPFDPARLPAFDRVVAALRDAGAIGSRKGVLLGFGVHLNVEIADDSHLHLWRIVTAFALLEPHLRKAQGIDVSRRLLPFVAPYPDALVDALAAAEPTGLPALVETYLTHAPTRNHGLDMLPVLAHLAPELVEGRITDGTETKPRPAYHFRMPDCRIDEGDWSIFVPWAAWLAVERLAASPALFDRLRRARRDWQAAPALARPRWSSVVAQYLPDAAAQVAQ